MRENKIQFLVTPEQYKFILGYYKERGIYPHQYAPTFYWDNGFEVILKGVGLSTEKKNDFEIIDLKDLGNDLSKWIKRFYEHSQGEKVIA